MYKPFYFKKQVFLKSLALLLFISIRYDISAQVADSILLKIKNNYTNEKIFVHFDKASYIAGETVWYKIYIVEGILPSAQSTGVCIEMLNDSGNVVDKKILPVYASAAIGNFELPNTLKTGAYKIKAYTARMMNFGMQNFYDHNISIYNPNEKMVKASAAKDYKIDFLPESGNLIAGITNCMAFKCTDQYGNPAAIEGVINDASQKNTIHFKSSFNGMGKFFFKPNIGESYTANCIIDNYQNKIINLPKVQNEGCLLSLSKKNGQTNFIVNKSNVGTNTTPSYLLGVIENTIAFKVPLNAETANITGVIPIDNLPTGILQLSVFNINDKPIAERLLFVNSNDYVSTSTMSVDTLNFTARQKNALTLHFLDTLAGTFSISVTDIGKQIDERVDNIVSRILLSSEIKGKVYDPNYYFESNDEEHQNNLDLVMLTNGWRRYTWKEIAENIFPPMAFKDMNYITTKGIAYDYKMGSVYKDGLLSVLTKTKNGMSDYEILETNGDGVFELAGMGFEDSAKIAFQKNEEKSPRVRLKITSPSLSNYFVLPQNAPLKFEPISISEIKFSKIKDLYNYTKIGDGKGILLDEVKITARKKTELEKYSKKYVSGIFGNNANKTLDFLKDPPKAGNTNILEYLKSKLSGVNISGGPIDYSINYRQNMSLSGGMIPMALYVDEFVTEPNMASTIPVDDVAMVQVFSNNSNGKTGGALAIYTKRGEGAKASGYTDLNILKVEGFTPVKEFYSPNYAESNDIYKDERSTIYWNPYLQTDKNIGNIHLSFFNSDNAKKYRIVVEGLQEDGKFLHIDKVVE